MCTPPVTRTVDGKNVVNVLAAMNEKIKDSKVIVARCALGSKRLADFAVTSIKNNCLLDRFMICYGNALTKRFEVR
jgi:hypothetical protein